MLRRDFSYITLLIQCAVRVIFDGHECDFKGDFLVSKVIEMVEICGVYVVYRGLGVSTKAICSLLLYLR